MLRTLLLGALGVGAWEGFWWARRKKLRATTYQEAKETAKRLGRLLIVVGAPDGGVTSGYGCGDYTIDAGESTCRPFIKADVTRPLPF